MLGTLNPSPTIDLGAPRRPAAPAQRTLASHSAKNSVDSAPAPSAVQRAAVAFEYASLRYQAHCPLGMYIIPSPENLSIWDGVLFVHQGYYTDSILKFRLTFPPEYPERAPAVHFITDIFHPLVSQQDGAFNLGVKFRPWRPQENHVYDILHYVKASFKKHALDQFKEADCFNKEAFRYHDSTSSFAALATQSSMLSQTASALFDSDHPTMAAKGPAHGLPFRELRPEQSHALRLEMGLQEWDDEAE